MYLDRKISISTTQERLDDNSNNGSEITKFPAENRFKMVQVYIDPVTEIIFEYNEDFKEEHIKLLTLPGINELMSIKDLFTSDNAYGCELMNIEHLRRNLLALQDELPSMTYGDLENGTVAAVYPDGSIVFSSKLSEKEKIEAEAHELMHILLNKQGLLMVVS